MRRPVLEEKPHCFICHGPVLSGIIDCFFPYHIEQNKCENCMTEDDKKRREEWRVWNESRTKKGE